MTAPRLPRANAPPRPTAPVTTLDMVLFRGEWRAVGVVSREEEEELERAHDAGDIRAEATLALLRFGRPEPRR